MMFNIVTDRLLRLFNSISPKRIFVWIILFCSVALEGAYIAEYFYHIHPCHLCLYQRYMFMIIMAIAVLTLLIKPIRYYKSIYAIISLLFFINASIAGYQVLIEHKVMAPPATCHAQKTKAKTVDELRAQLKDVKIVPCDEPSWIFLGISMAGYNLIYCLLLSGLSFIATRNYYDRKFTKL